MPTSFLVWFLLAAFMPCIMSAPLQLNSTLDDWLQNRTRRELCVSKRSPNSSEVLGDQENQDTGAAVPQNSTLNGRVKRSCKLVTCSMHDLAHAISQISKKRQNAPPHKLTPCGFGRRRRHSLRQDNADPAHGEDPQDLSPPQAQRRDTKLT